MATTTWNRGRDADSPTEVPAQGWKDIALRVKDEISKDRLSLISAAMAYYALFAFVPAISSVVLIYALISDPNGISELMAKFSNILPSEMVTLIDDQLTTLASKASSTLGWSAVLALLVALWSASKGSKAIMEALNIIYDEEDKRGFIKQNLLAIGMTFLAAFFGLCALGVIVVIPAVANYVGISKGFQFGVTAASWIILLGLFAVYLAFVYRFGPDRRKAKWKWVSAGAVIAAGFWAIASALFSWYASEFGNFNKTYGSLGAIIVLMTWFYLSSFIILIGGEVNAELEHQTKKDSTVGSSKPMGMRDATMADNVGESSRKPSVFKRLLNKFRSKKKSIINGV